MSYSESSARRVRESESRAALVAATGRHHVRQGGLGSVHDPHVVGLKLGLYVVDARLEERLVQPVGGVVDQHVHPPPTLDGRIHKALDLWLVRHVGDHGEDFIIVAVESVADAFEAVFHAVTDGHAATFVRESPGDLRTDAAGTCDHDYLATQGYHRAIPGLAPGMRVLVPVVDPRSGEHTRKA